MAMQTAGDIPLLIASENSSSERRITPSWTIGQLKAKLEPVTGIPPLSQSLTLRLGGQQPTPIEAVDEENTRLSAFPLAPYAEIIVSSAGQIFNVFVVVVPSYNLILFSAFSAPNLQARAVPRLVFWCLSEQDPDPPWRRLQELVVRGCGLLRTNGLCCP